MKIKTIIGIYVLLILVSVLVAFESTPENQSYVKEDDGIYQHIVLESGDLQLELRHLLIDPYHMSFEYAVTQDGIFVDGYEINLSMPDIYDKPIQLSIANENQWQDHQISTTNDFYDKTETKLEATLKKDGETTIFTALDLDLSHYTIFYIGDIMINQTIMLNECSVDIIKMSYTKDTVDLYYDVHDTEDSFISYLHFNIYAEDGTKYKTDSTQWGDTSIKTAKFFTNEAFINSDTIKIEANQANVTTIVDTFDFSDDGMIFDYEGYRYQLNLTDIDDYQSNFELVCDSEEIPAFPDLVYKTTDGWANTSHQTDDDVLAISSLYIPDFLIVDDSDFKLSAENIVEFYKEHYKVSYDVEDIQAILPTILNKEVKVFMASDGSLINNLKYSLWAYDDLVKVGIASPNEIKIVTQSIKINLK